MAIVNYCYTQSSVVGLCARVPVELTRMNPRKRKKKGRVFI